MSTWYDYSLLQNITSLNNSSFRHILNIPISFLIPNQMVVLSSLLESNYQNLSVDCKTYMDFFFYK